MRPDSITLAIFEKYKPEELAETAQKLVQALADKETAETEKKISDSAFKERINQHEAEAAALAKQYGKGGETAQIGCDIRYDHPEPGKKSYFRMDRNELVETHDMSWEERQETLQFPLNASPETETIAQPTEEQVNDASIDLDTRANILDALHAPPPDDDEVTRICPFPGCLHFADHDGEHTPPMDVAPPESEPEKPKRQRKKRDMPPPEPPCQEPPADSQGLD